MSLVPWAQDASDRRSGSLGESFGALDFAGVHVSGHEGFRRVFL